MTFGCCRQTRSSILLLKSVPQAWIQVSETMDNESRVQRLDFAAWRKLSRFALPHRKPLLGLMGAGLLLAVSESLLPLLTARIVDDAIGVQPGGGLAVYAASYLALVFFNAS